MLKNIYFNTLPVYDDRYVKSKIRTYGDKIYDNFPGLNMPENCTECESFTILSIDFYCLWKQLLPAKYI